MIDVINSERIKLTSVRSPYWCVGIVVAIAVAVAVLMGATTTSPIGTTPAETASFYLVGVNQFGFLVLMILAVLAITSEYRFGTIRIAFQAVPRRSVVLGAKAVVYGALAVVVSLVMTIVSLVLIRSLAGPASGIEMSDSGVVRQLWGTPVVALLGVLIGIGIGAILRHTAGAIVVLLIWNLAVENILAVLPKVGTSIAPFLPFRNGARFLSGTGGDFHWGVYGSLVYFGVVAMIVFGVGILVTSRRDA
ncbi:ABC transporter permease [Gordonia soli]|uniref:Putative ABC transporter permease protein n=1 Tax=Gordonia soli NBRC 108243 TaxID=1223545 RepID=M0QFY4_9ACTN|nr:ABC transporter permease [Gordonia soli]GAC67530.1 putative ABC transporter permease protein [Gordonia soli NBRC 108243]